MPKAISRTLSFVPFCAPTLVPQAPAGDGWIHEIKHDGYRCQIVIQGTSVRVFTRNGYDWTERYQPVAIAGAMLDCESAIIDGEMIVQDEQGRSDFEALAAAIRRAPARLVFFAFDLLHLDGQDLRKRPLLERRARLRDLIHADARSPIQFSDHVAGGGPAFFAEVEKMGLEGIVSKRADSLYRSGPSRRWLKIKCWTESEFTIVGAEIDRRGIPIAILARDTDEGLAFAGGAVIALKGADRDKLAVQLDRLAVERTALKLSRAGARWIRPELRVRVKHLRGAGALRHASVKALLD